jgi:Tol biopolymer transport system component
VSNSANRAGAVGAWSRRGLRLAYARADGIFVVDADGRDRKRVVRKPSRLAIDNLVWSAGRLVFTETMTSNDLEIYTVGSDGSSVQPLTRNQVDDLQPSWSADGRQLAFVRLTATRPTRPEIWVMNADGSGQRLIIRNGAEPFWTADGTRIVYTRFGAGSDSIWSVSVSTGREDLLISDGFHGAPSPEGTKLAFIRGLGPGRVEHQIFLAAADGSGENALRPGSGPLSWSPDSTTLAFARCMPVPSVCAIGVDGSGLTNIPLGEPWPRSYSFSPEGTSLIFSSGTRYPTSQIEVCATDGSERRVVTANRGRNDNPAWQPRPE